MDFTTIQKQAEDRFAPFPIKLSERVTVHLRSVVKLPEKQRDHVRAMLNVSDAQADAEAVEQMKDVLRTVATTKAGGEALLKAIGGDVAVLMETIRAWAEHTKAGEA